MFASGFFVIVEPAPCDLLFVAAMTFCCASGLRLSPLIAAPILCLLLYNLGGFASYLQVLDDGKSRMFVITSTYMAASAIFLAAYLHENTERRIAIINNGFVIAGSFAAVIGIASYFNVGGLVSLSPMGRVQGTFKDPNVISTFLIYPVIVLVQGLMTSTSRRPILTSIVLLAMLVAIFLAFSRGAWMNLVGAITLLAVLTFALTGSNRIRARIILLGVVGTAAAAVLLAYLLSFESVQTLFADRFTLAKSYDSGERGRFGIQLNSLRHLIELPLGVGPLYFAKHFGHDPHNVFLNAFASYGWLGGVSYALLIASTVAAGIRAILIKSPLQPAAIAVFCPLLTTILQGVQIDTDHWRHFYWLLGMSWGLFAASTAYLQCARQKLRMAQQSPP